MITKSEILNPKSEIYFVSLRFAEIIAIVFKHSLNNMISLEGKSDFAASYPWPLAERVFHLNVGSHSYDVVR